MHTARPGPEAVISVHFSEHNISMCFKTLEIQNCKHGQVLTMAQREWQHCLEWLSRRAESVLSTVPAWVTDSDLEPENSASDQGRAGARAQAQVKHSLGAWNLQLEFKVKQQQQQHQQIIVLVWDDLRTIWSNNHQIPVTSNFLL